jgi:hypothetical protein
MIRYTLFLSIIMLFSSIHAGKKTQVDINPEFISYDSIFTDLKLKFYLNSISAVDSVKDRPLGTTQIGKKTIVPLLCKPQIDSVLYSSLSGFLKYKKLNATSAFAADYLLDLRVLHAQTTEQNQGLTQTMTAQLTVEVKVKNPLDSTMEKTFIIEAKNSKEALDTTKQAADIFRGVIEVFIREMLKNIS